MQYIASRLCLHFHLVDAALQILYACIYNPTWRIRNVHWEWSKSWEEGNILPFTVSFMAENALNTAADAAVQVYIPESSSLGFQIWSVPSTLTLDLPTGSSSFFLTQVTVGLGSPVALQETVIFWFFPTSSVTGGLTVKRGSSTTFSCVNAESYPKIFVASHLYKPESFFWAFVIVNCPSFMTVLDCTSSPCTADHVITAGG